MKVGVVGAGTMGAGIAQTFAQKEGFQVLLCDTSVFLAQKGKERIRSSLAGRVGKGKLNAGMMGEILDRITVVKKDDLAECDLVIEAVLEQMQLKKELFKELDRICKPDCLFATNTSSISITELSHSCSRRIAGMHFFNPAPVMKLVELVYGMDTPEDFIEKLKGVAIALDKTPVLVQETAGFVVNRILVPMINEAIGLLAEGTASVTDIDAAMKLGANHPMGPLELGDLIGLDVVLAIMEVLQAETGDSKYRPHPYLKKMVRSGKLGRKTNEGFYSY